MQGVAAQCGTVRPGVAEDVLAFLRGDGLDLTVDQVTVLYCSVHPDLPLINFDYCSICRVARGEIIRHPPPPPPALRAIECY